MKKIKGAVFSEYKGFELPLIIPEFKKLLLCYPRRSRTAFVEYYTAFKNKPIKEVKKVNKIPYFELKVVKVKKVEKEWTPDYCPCCGQKKVEKKWVNGENLDKIKFPVPCSYIGSEDKKKHIGMLNCYVNWYRLYNIEKQSKDNFVDDCTSLKNLINSYDIHILKGKILIFEEEE